MKAFQIKQLQHPSKIKVSNDAPRPKPNKSEVLVDVYAAGLNFFDILQAQGKYQRGAEFSGRISADSPIPKGCAYKPGDRVYGFALGAYGEQVAVNPALLCRIPDHLSYLQTAVVPLTHTTSYAGLVDRGRAQKGEWVLVHAAAGGVGLAAVQIAKAIGCKVIAAAGSDSKRRIAKEQGGADEVVDYNQEGWQALTRQKEVLRLTGGKGVDVVYDPVGMLVPSLKCVNWNARLVVVGFAAGTIEKVPANLVLLKQVSINGLAWGQTYLKDPARAFEVQKQVHALLASRQLTPVTYEPIYEGLEQVARGLVDIEERRTWGKGAVRVRDDEGRVIQGEEGDGRAKL